MPNTHTSDTKTNKSTSNNSLQTQSNPNKRTDATKRPHPRNRLNPYTLPPFELSFSRLRFSSGLARQFQSRPLKPSGVSSLCTPRVRGSRAGRARVRRSRRMRRKRPFSERAKDAKEAAAQNLGGREDSRFFPEPPPRKNTGTRDPVPTKKSRHTNARRLWEGKSRRNQLGTMSR